MKSPFDQINTIEFSPEVTSVGIVTSLGDGIVKVDGLGNAMMGEEVAFGHVQEGLVLNLKANEVGVIVLADGKGIESGQEVKTTGRILSVGFGEGIMCRVVSSLGTAIDGKPQFPIKKYEALEKIAPGVMSRKGVSVPLQTGIKSVDAMIPIGRGQRELIIGDRGTGKSAVALSTIINQKDTGVISVYVTIGQKQSFRSEEHTSELQSPDHL